MSLNLDALRDEISDYLERHGFVVFRGYSRLADVDSFVAWDAERYPDYRMFLDAAKNVGVKLIVFNHQEFSTAHVDDSLERLESSDLPRDEQRSMERRLREMRGYDGFTCALELSFDFQGRVYMFSLHSEWYEDYLDILDEINASVADEDGGEEDESMGGYFSRN